MKYQPDEPRNRMKSAAMIVALALATACGTAQTQTPATPAAPAPARSPAVLPGNGLAQHDFAYAGESHQRRIFIVRGGKVVWSYDDPTGKGEISDMVMLANGNILVAHQFGLDEISPDKKVIWNYTPPPGKEVHTAVPIGNDRVLYIENGAPTGLLRVVNIRTNKIEKEFPLDVSQPPSTHGQFRHARLTPQGTVLVAHLGNDKVVEYDSDGHILWSMPAPNPWSASQLPNGHILITDKNGVREMTRRGEVAWSWTPADTPAYKFASLQNAYRLKNGDTVINNWVNEWNNDANDAPGAVQAIEVTPDKKVVWALREWGDGKNSVNLGPATTIQFLDQGYPPIEDAHFGDIH
jgi:hypothetical protein